MAHIALSAALGAFAACLFGSVALAQVNTCYSYDTLGRVLTAGYGNGVTVSYAYDAAGNRTQQSTAMVSDNFTGGPASALLIENTCGVVEIGTWNGSSITFTQVSGLGSE